MRWALVVALLLQVLLIPHAQAAPTRASAQAELEKLATEIARVDEEFNLARLELQRNADQRRSLKAEQASAAQNLTDLRRRAGERAAAIYRMGTAPTILAIFGSSDRDNLVERIRATDRIGAHDARLTESLQIATQQADRRAETLASLQRRAEGTQSDLETRRRQLDRQMAEQKRLLDRIAAAEAAAARPKPAAKPRPVINFENLPASATAKAAVQTASEQIGKPYRYGASGPDSFDCSGLTMFSWRKAGVSLPHSSRAQFGATKRVAREDLQPGDLVFFGSPIHHVGMYVGNGNMINSPETGERVDIRSMNRRDYVGAGRPGV